RRHCQGDAALGSVEKLGAAALQCQRFDLPHEPLDDLARVLYEVDGKAEGFAHDPKSLGEASADAWTRQLARPVAAARAGEIGLDAQPQRLRVDHEPIHVEQESLAEHDASPYYMTHCTLTGAPGSGHSRHDTGAVDVAPVAGPHQPGDGGSRDGRASRRCGA